MKKSLKNDRINNRINNTKKTKKNKIDNIRHGGFFLMI